MIVPPNDLNYKWSYTCEVRWPGPSELARELCYTLGIDDEKFVFVGKLLRIVNEFTKRAVAEISENSHVEFTETWKPAINHRSMTLQRLFTIEIRVDFRDETKLPLFERIIQQAGRHVYGQSALLGDGVKPEIVIHAHDFFKGHQDIALFDDAALNGEIAIQEASVPREARSASGSPLASVEPVPEGFSDELIRELRK